MRELVFGQLFVIIALMAAIGVLIAELMKRRGPWQLQRHLMEVSGQQLPDRPAMTQETILYYALILEEAAETGAVLSSLIASMKFKYPHSAVALHSIYDRIQNAAGVMDAHSKGIRKLLTMCKEPIFEFLTLEEAKLLLDGTTDIAVVNCGFAESAGLPGAQAYDEVGCSNLSKKDPVTGKILKDASGKWIKGPNYQEPDLRRVLHVANPYWFDGEDLPDTRVPGGTC